MNIILIGCILTIHIPLLSFITVFRTLYHGKTVCWENRNRLASIGHSSWDVSDLVDSKLIPSTSRSWNIPEKRVTYQASIYHIYFIWKNGWISSYFTWLRYSPTTIVSWWWCAVPEWSHVIVWQARWGSDWHTGTDRAEPSSNWFRSLRKYIPKTPWQMIPRLSAGPGINLILVVIWPSGCCFLKSGFIRVASRYKSLSWIFR